MELNSLWQQCKTSTTKVPGLQSKSDTSTKGLCRRCYSTKDSKSSCLYRSKRRRSDRLKTIEVPLFPGYLFCRFNPARKTPVLRTPGVIRIVGAGGRSIPVDETEVAAIKTVVASRLKAQPCSFLNQGQVVKIDEGPLARLEGVVVSWKGGHRLIVSVTFLHRSVAVELDPRHAVAAEGTTD